MIHAAVVVVLSLGFRASLATVAEGRQDGAVPVPGLQGFGAETRGGIGGRLMAVTHLRDFGAGSLREALVTKGARVVVFEVGGVLRLSRHLKIDSPFVTVAGETAPSPGITLTGASLLIRSHDVVVRHLRVRTGDAPLGPSPADRDGIKIQGLPYAVSGAYNIVIDHCSISWATDEGVSLWYPGIHDVTVCRSIIAENLSHSLHPKGEHSKGLLVGSGARRIAILRNLFAHNQRRNPFLKAGTSSLVVNNLIYNPGSAAVHLERNASGMPIQATIMGNRVVPGPDTPVGLPAVKIRAQTGTVGEVYATHNLVRQLAPSPPQGGQVRQLELRGTPPVWVEPLQVDSPEDLPEDLLQLVGARPRDRDDVDRRIIREVRSGGGRIIDSPAQVGGLASPPVTRRPLHPPANPASVPAWLEGFAQQVENR